MNPYNKIKAYVKDIEKESKNLDLDQTIKMLEAVKEISQNKELIEKVICLVLLIENEKKDVKTLEATIKTQAALIAKLEQRLTALEKK